MADTSKSESNEQINEVAEVNSTENNVTDSPQDETEEHTPAEPQENSAPRAVSDDTKENAGETEEEEKYVKQEDGKSASEPTLKSLYQFRSRPTLPYLLTEYGMEDKDAPVLKKKEQKKKKKSSFGDDSGRDPEKDRQREERHLQIVQDMHRLRDYYYDEYTTLLQNKVEKQRHDIRQRSNALNSRLAEQEEAQRQGSHKVKRRLERHALSSDNSFLKDIPKTDRFYIVQLQDKLIKEGKLKTQSDFDNFWENIQRPEVFYHYFKVHKSDSPGHGDYSDNAFSDSSPLHDNISSNSVDDQRPSFLNTRSLSRIPESKESPTSLLEEKWAITQQHKAVERQRRSSFAGPKPQAAASHKSSYLQDLEKRFPKLEMPKLHCFTMEMGPKFRDAKELAREQALQHKEDERQARKQIHTKMHQCSMAHAAFTKRLLEKMDEDGMPITFEGFGLSDLISDYRHYLKLPSPPDTTVRPDPFAVETFYPSHEQKALPPVPEQDSTQHGRRGSGKSSKRSKSAKKKEGKSPSAEPKVEKPAPPVPLSLEEVISPVSPDVPVKAAVRESKCLSTLWINYMKNAPVKEVETV